MAQTLVPHLVNDLGAEQIRIGVKEFQCMGATPPHDHPHVYLDMGDETQLVCPYCSTLYVHDPALAQSESEPPGAVFAATAPPGAPEA
ncbi:MAG: zinc-finger domain-containing protein [Methyloceanibacter sp.]|uniref:zinc-finger domain-containing protein n=1 Tax=Methyloceanibacter sp. TaxID=1965321 RepID=UPI003D9AC1A4